MGNIFAVRQVRIVIGLLQDQLDISNSLAVNRLRDKKCAIVDFRILTPRVVSSLILCCCRSRSLQIESRSTFLEHDSNYL